MSRIRLVLSLGCLIILAGCGDTKPTDSVSSNAAAPEDNLGVADTAGPGVSLSEPSDTAASDAAAPAATEPPSGTAAAPTETKSAPAEGESLDPLVDGLEFPNVDIRKEFTTRKANWEKAPTDADAAGSFIELCYSLGGYHARQGNMEKAHSGFTRAGEIMDKALAGGATYPDDMKAAVYYSHACAVAVAGKAEDAMGILQKSIDNGFSDFSQLESDGDLASVRALPAFAEKQTAWLARVKELMIEKVKEELAQGESFPFDFQLTDVAGAAISLQDFKGKVCIVDIWGTWCPPCRAEIPSFIKLQENYGSKGFQMIGLNQESGSQEEKTKLVTDYISSAGINYPCALIPEELLQSVPNFEGFPTTLFIDRTGKVRLKAVGLHEYAYLEAVVSTLLAEEAPATEAPATEAPAAGASE